MICSQKKVKRKSLALEEKWDTKAIYINIAMHEKMIKGS